MAEDETLGSPAHEIADETLRATRRYWQEWVRGLAVPFEWQEAAIRAAITLQLCTYEDNGAVLAALDDLDSRRPPDSGRNWDYRYCWLRDAYFTVQAHEPPGRHRPMEAYLRYLRRCRRSEPAAESAAGVRHHRRARARGAHRRDPRRLIAAWARCGSATWPTVSASTMFTAR